MPKLHIIIGSTRPGRLGPAVARWIHDYAQSHGKFEAELVDLADFNLPIYDEPKSPRLKDYQHEHTRRWAASVDAADAFVFVAPEYNYMPSPALVNALDFLYHEWNYKPAGIASYGGVAAGARAGNLLRIHLSTLKMMPIPEGVLAPMVASLIDKDTGAFQTNDLITTSAKAMLDELSLWTEALKSLRS